MATSKQVKNKISNNKKKVARLDKELKVAKAVAAKLQADLKKAVAAEKKAPKKKAVAKKKAAPKKK